LNSGTFDISQTNAGAAVTSLQGLGTVALGNRTLTITGPDNPANFGGVIVDGGLGGGAGGSLVIASGVNQTLSGVNTYTARRRSTAHCISSAPAGLRRLA
jgi:hypothetical protein